MTKKELMVKAHKLTKEIKNEYPEVDYKFQLGLCLAYLQSEGEVKMVELKGSEKQVKWANDIREVVLLASRRNLELKQEFYNEKPNSKMRTRVFNEAKELNEKIENEESAKFFIENFAFIIKEKEELERLEKEIEGVNALNKLADSFIERIKRM